MATLHCSFMRTFMDIDLTIFSKTPHCVENT
nr:MAG TPA: hypothetical protein [Bacteriophage sp.]